VSVDAKNIGNFKLTSPEFGSIILNYASAHTLKFKYPPVGVFQNGSDAYLFRRFAQRQYTRALCAGNSTCVPVSYQLTGGREKTNALGFGEVLAAYEGEKHSFKEAVQMLKSGKYRSVALYRNFSLMLNVRGADSYLLMFWETPIAYINTETLKETMIENVFASVIPQIRSY
jgi:hypothetical protein